MSSQKEWCSLREFARRCKRTHRAAQKAIMDGRIPSSSVRWDEHGHIVAVEYHQAAACWRANTLTFMRPDVPKPRPAAPFPDAVTQRIGVVLGVAFANALIPACGMLVLRHRLAPAQALDALEDLLLAAMFSTAEALGLEEGDDRLQVLFRDELEQAMTAEQRPALLERIAAGAAMLAADDEAAALKAQ